MYLDFTASIPIFLACDTPFAFEYSKVELNVYDLRCASIFDQYGSFSPFNTMMT